MQCPGERAMPSSIPRQAHSSRFPAQRSAQYFHASVPLPSVVPAKLPLSIGPAGKKIAGRLADVAPMISAGVVLSHPPMSTAPSIGWLRSTSSVSIASRLR